MLRTLFLAAAGAFCGAVVITAALLGGCGGKVTGVPAATSPARAATAEPDSDAKPDSNPAADLLTSSAMLRDTDQATLSNLPEIGRDPSRLGRLEKEAVVDATVFHAEHGTSRPGAVRLAPGTWLLPAGALPPPDDSPPAADGGR